MILIAADRCRVSFPTAFATQRQAGPRTIAACRALHLILGFAHAQSGKLPAQLDWVLALTTTTMATLGRYRRPDMVLASRELVTMLRSKSPVS